MNEESKSESFVSNTEKTKGKRGRKMTEEEKYKKESLVKIAGL